MKNLLLFLFLGISTSFFSQDIVQMEGNATLIADFSSLGEAPNVKGEYLKKYQTLVSIIEGTQTVKCMVRIENMVNVIGVWELNDLNDLQVKVYEVVIENGKTDILLVSVQDNKAISLNLLRRSGDELTDLGYNYIEQKTPGEPMIIKILGNKIQVVYDKGTEQPLYGIVAGQFIELPPSTE